MSNFIPQASTTTLAVPALTGLQLSWLSTTTLSVALGQCFDSGLTNLINLPAATTINGAANGLNGLDTGTLAATSQYNVFVVADASGFNQPGLIISLSPIPLMPAGKYTTNYSLYRRIGVVFTDGSSHFLKFYQTGADSNRTYFYDSMVSVLSGGVATSFTAVDLSACVPAYNKTPVLFYASYTPATAANKASFRPTGSSATTVFDITGVVAAKAQDLQFKTLSLLASAKAEIDYEVANSSDALSLSVLGFDDFI